MRLPQSLPVPRLVWESGWGIGVLIALLQLATALMPAGEGRDWVYYYATGGWAALFILSGFAERYMAAGGRLDLLKKLCTAYAVLALGYYFILPLVSLWILALCALAFAAARLYAKPRDAAWLAWLLLAFSMCGSLLYNSPWLALMHKEMNAQYALAFAAFLAFTSPFTYAALRRPYTDAAGGKALHPALILLLHAAAIYVLVLLLFSAGRLETRFAIHHWKAYLEPAASLRDGGWLLWDVPNVYGFLQTLLMAVLPTDSTWQSLYLINGTLLAASAYMIFYALFSRYRSLAGYAGALLVAVACAVMVLPTTGDPRMFPSTGSLRFFWVYPMAGYVFWLCRRFFAAGRLPRFAAMGGNAIWLLGVLWSLEGALFVTVIWLPSLLMVTVAEYFTLPARALARKVLVAVALLLLPLAVVAAAIALIYQLRLGHAPDMSLVTAYAKAFAFDYATLPIAQFAALPCWLFVFALMALACRQFVMQAPVTAQAAVALAALYAALSALWAVTSYYIPFSEDLHLTGTLPVMVYLSALLLLLMPLLALPAAFKAAFEKGMVCFYSVIILGTLAHLPPDMFAALQVARPVHPDVTEVLPEPEPPLKELIARAHIPAGAHVQVLSQPMVHRDGNHVLEHAEGIYMKGMGWKPWLLPNTILGYDAPLAPELYQRLGSRRAARMDNAQGWVIEKKDNPLENYPWIKNTVEQYYRQSAVMENREYRIRAYERLPAAQ